MRERSIKNFYVKKDYIWDPLFRPLESNCRLELNLFTIAFVMCYELIYISKLIASDHDFSNSTQHYLLPTQLPMFRTYPYNNDNASLSFLQCQFYTAAMDQLAERSSRMRAIGI